VHALLVPVKAFSEAKHRLSPVLDAASRREIARRLGERVLQSAGGARRYVVCDDDEVADWAVAHGAEVLFTPGLGLSGAVTAGVAHLARNGVDHVVVAHADLPFAYDLDRFGAPGEVTLAPDRRVDGTNVISLPPEVGFEFSYGPGSYRRHRIEAARVGLAARSVHDSRLSLDLDTPADLAALEARPEAEALLSELGGPAPADPSPSPHP
jgi:2-phospho-L-lactate/phosphoenolpyruvate guanylyltransferase